MNGARQFKRLAPGALLLVSFAWAIACNTVQTRSGLPPEAQATIDAVTSDIARGDDDKIYAEAADEWRRAASAEVSRAHLARLRASLGNVRSRAQVGAQERERTGSGDLAGHTLIVNYNTEFERAHAIETFTLIKREGRWLLARYAVNSNALK